MATSAPRGRGRETFEYVRGEPAKSRFRLQLTLGSAEVFGEHVESRRVRGVVGLGLDPGGLLAGRAEPAGGDPEGLELAFQLLLALRVGATAIPVADVPAGAARSSTAACRGGSQHRQHRGAEVLRARWWAAGGGVPAEIDHQSIYREAWGGIACYNEWDRRQRKQRKGFK